MRISLVFKDNIQFIQHFLFKMSMLGSIFSRVKWRNNFVSLVILFMFFVFYDSVEILGVDQRREALGKEKLMVVNSTVVPNITVLFPPSLKGNKILSTFIEHVMCVRHCAKYLLYFNPVFLSTPFKVLFLFYRKRKLTTNWVSSLKVSQLLAGKKRQDFNNLNSIMGAEISRKIHCMNTVGWLLKQLQNTNFSYSLTHSTLGRWKLM